MTIFGFGFLDRGFLKPFRYLFFIWLLCAAAESSEPEKIALQFKWRHQFQFAGYYAAKEKGFYAEEGLEVDFITLKPGINVVEEVLSGRATYGISDAGLLLNRAQGAPVVLLAQVFQHSPLIFIAKRESGIISPYQMVGKKVMFQKEGSNAALMGMLLDTLEDISKIDYVPHSMQLEDLISGEVDVISAYLIDQPYILKKKGIEVNVINPQNYGIDYYGDNLFTTESELENHPDRVDRMIRATLKGWEYALTHKSEIIDLILEKYASNRTRDQLEFEARMTELMILPDLIRLGEVNPGRYNKIAELYGRLGLSEKGQVPKGFIYQRGDERSKIVSDQERSWLQAHPDLMLGFSTGIEPILIQGQDGHYSGLLPDYLSELNRALGARIGLKASPVDTVLEELNQGKIDGVMAMGYESAKSSGLLTTKPFFFGFPAVFMHGTAPFSVNSLEDLKGKTVSVIKGIRFYKELLRPYQGDIEVLEYPSGREAMAAVYQGQADAMLGFTIQNYLVSKYQFAGMVPAHILWDQKLEVVMGIRPDRAELVPILNKGIQRCELELNAIIAKWSQIEGPGSGLNLSEEEFQWLDEHPVIRVGFHSSWPPVGFRDAKGNYQGISVEILNRVERKLNVTFEPVYSRTLEELLQMVRTDEVDMCSGLAVTEKRRDVLSFTKPFTTLPIVIFGRNESNYIGSLNELHQHKVAVISGFGIEEMLQADHPEIELVQVESLEDGIRQVSQNEVIAYIGSLLNTGHYLQKSREQFVKVIGETPYSYNLAMAYRSDWPLLGGILQKAIDSLSESERNEIQNKWVSVKFEHGFDYTLVWKILALGALVVAGFIYWNRKLRREVARQTAALRVSEKKFRDLYLNAQVGLVRTTVDEGKVLECNEVFAQLLGYESCEACVADWISSEHYARPGERERVLETIKREGGIANYPVQLTGKEGGPIWVELSASGYGEQGFLEVVVVDISERKQTEKERKALEQQIQQNQKLESIGTLAGGVAHDFNNILTGILGFAELVQNQLEPGTSAHRMQQELINAAIRATDLVKQILLFSRQTQQERVPVQPHHVLKEAIKLLRHSIPATIEIKQDISSHCGSILADPTQIHQIVMNLCTNGYHAMREKGGVLFIKLDQVDISSDDISFTKLQMDPGSYLRLEVSDTGHGMDSSTLEKIFLPYFSTKPEGEGTGMGLAVVHGIVKSFGGQIKVYSEPGKGTSFKLYFPKLEVEGARHDTTREALPQGKRECILLVDDEQVILDMMSTSLEGLGYKVVPQKSSLAALQVFKQEPTRFDLVVTDMTMPQMTGLELTKHIFEVDPDFPVILCTGFSEMISEEKAKALGIKQFLTKPILRKDLAFAIRQALNTAL